MKLPYRVPTMSEIAALAQDAEAPQVISTFSGCGGSSLGYKMAGYRVLWANEFVPAAQDTYRANYPDTLLDPRSVREIQATEILETLHLRPGELDLLDGSPPCASFSTSGRRHKNWGRVKSYSDTAERTDDLFYEYARLLKGLQPRVFLAENVSGLVKGTAKGYFIEILEALKACGYRVAAALLDAQYLGVPQVRQRIFFMGVRTDLGREPVFPKPLNDRYSLQDAAGAEVIAYCAGGAPDRWKSAQEPYGTVVQSGGHLSRTAYLSANGYVRVRTGVRKLTIAELKRICSFPDDFILTGTFEQQWERLGRAVPPVMMYHVAKTIKEQILCPRTYPPTSPASRQSA